MQQRMHMLNIMKYVATIFGIILYVVFYDEMRAWFVETFNNYGMVIFSVLLLLAMLGIFWKLEAINNNLTEINKKIASDDDDLD